MKRIKDSIHNYIEINGVAEDLLDTAKVQRLRRIKQLGTTYLVYPSANHTRFEHSLGVYYLSNKAVQHLEIEGDSADTIRAAALLHDVGHGPFSHNTEPILKRETGKYHDGVRDLIDEQEIVRILDNHGVDIAGVINIIEGQGPYGRLLSSKIDIDRMDYLVRDAHHTGVPYGSIDHDRLISQLEFDGPQLTLSDSSIHAAQSLLSARALMYPTVYGHHTTRISEMMLQRSTETLIDEDIIRAEDLRDMDDYDLVSALRMEKKTEGMMRRLDDRDLFKRSLWLKKDDVPGEILDLKFEEIRDSELEIASKVGIDEQMVIIDVPSRFRNPRETSRDVSAPEVGIGPGVGPLHGAVMENIDEHWRFGVYCPRKYIDVVGEQSYKLFGISESNGKINELLGQETD